MERDGQPVQGHCAAGLLLLGAAAPRPAGSAVPLGAGGRARRAQRGPPLGPAAPALDIISRQHAQGVQPVPAALLLQPGVPSIAALCWCSAQLCLTAPPHTCVKSRECSRGACLRPSDGVTNPTAPCRPSLGCSTFLPFNPGPVQAFPWVLKNYVRQNKTWEADLGVRRSHRISGRGDRSGIVEKWRLVGRGERDEQATSCQHASGHSSPPPCTPMQHTEPQFARHNKARPKEKRSFNPGGPPPPPRSLARSTCCARRSWRRCAPRPTLRCWRCRSSQSCWTACPSPPSRWVPALQV